MKLDYHVILDLPSGTFFGADNAYIIDTRNIPPTELDTFNEGGDSDRREIAEKYGTDLEQIAGDSAAMDIIARTLSGAEWTPDLFDAIADLVRATGRTIEDIQ